MRYKGAVQKGTRIAGKLGVPTVNIALAHEDPISGIFAAEVLFDGNKYPAAAYINTRKHVLEAHLLDFSGDLYGKEVEIELLEKLRDDRSFIGSPALRAAISGDIAKVRKYFKN